MNKLGFELKKRLKFERQKLIMLIHLLDIVTTDHPQIFLARCWLEEWYDDIEQDGDVNYPLEVSELLDLLIYLGENNAIG